MRKGRSGFHPDQTGRQIPQEVEHRTPSKPLLKNNHATGANAVQVQYGLGEIDPECCNLNVGGSFPQLVLDSTSMARRDAVGV